MQDRQHPTQPQHLHLHPALVLSSLVAAVPGLEHRHGVEAGLESVHAGGDEIFVDFHLLRQKSRAQVGEGFLQQVDGFTRDRIAAAKDNFPNVVQPNQLQIIHQGCSSL